MIEGADHYLGNLICRLDRDEPAQPEAWAMVNTVTSSFLNAHIRRDPDSMRLLDSKQLETATDSKASLRRR